MPDFRLIVFVKAPRPGTVKTRLAQSVGAESACQIYRELVGRVMREAGSLPAGELRFSPADGLVEIEEWMPAGWRARPQAEGDLGQRMAEAFATAFREGVTRAVLIGSDCPQITRDDVRAAASALADHDAVFGPADDGGYWLVALRHPVPELFENIRWSTESALDDTLAAARRLGLKMRLLRMLSDVDTEADWLRLAGDGSGGAEPGELLNRNPGT